jgi:hypothetical protein
MMIARTLGFSFAILIAGLIVAGTLLLIALDMVGEEALLKLWRSTFRDEKTSASISGLEGAKDITFFASAPVESTGLTVETGVRFATLADLRGKKQAERWCYVLLSANGGLPRRIALGTQSGFGAPIYNDLSIYPSAELSILGPGAARLHSLARTHCRFAQRPSQAGVFEGENQ